MSSIFNFKNHKFVFFFMLICTGISNAATYQVHDIMNNSVVFLSGGTFTDGEYNNSYPLFWVDTVGSVYFSDVDDLGAPTVNLDNLTIDMSSIYYPEYGLEPPSMVRGGIRPITDNMDGSYTVEWRVNFLTSVDDDWAFEDIDFNMTFSNAEVPIPAAAWLFASGLLGLISCVRRRK